MAGVSKKQVEAAILTLRRATFDDLSQSQQEEITKLGVELIQRDYWADVRHVAKELIERIKEGEIRDDEGLNEALDEAVDATQRVIYTFEAKLGMIATDNPDAWEELGFEHPTVEQMMFSAMRADVEAQLQAEDARDLFKEED